MTTEQPAVTDITVNLEALWLLQALLGIPRLASELRRLEPLHGAGWRGGRTSPVVSFRVVPFYD